MTTQPITNGLPPIHPGEYLREILDDMALTQSALADALGARWTELAGPTSVPDAISAVLLG